MTYLELLRQHLPVEISLAELMSLGKAEWWRARPVMAAAYAMRKCGKLDWLAYLANYPDVKAANVDAAWHFVKDGIFEGRKLYAKNANAHLDPVQHCPNISIIISNYNNAAFLDKCLNSVINQTLQNIEIIIVDDASTDDSMSIISRFADVDERINVIRHQHNQSQHMAKCHGVALARGEYIMFLDSDDFYYCYTCEKAYEYARQGYDIVCFNTNVINSRLADASKIDGMKHWLNSFPAGEYKSCDIMLAAFENEQLNFNLWSKIFNGDICRKSFAGMDGGHYIRDEDLYEFLVIITNSKKFLKVDDVLYNYAYGIGLSNTDSRGNDLGRSYVPGKILAPIDVLAQT